MFIISHVWGIRPAPLVGPFLSSIDTDWLDHQPNVIPYDTTQMINQTPAQVFK